MLFPSAAASSQGKDYLRHWGVLISDMSLIDLQVILSRTRDFGANDNTMWGTMLELFRDEDKKNNVNIKDFGMKTLREEWPMFSMAYVGKTSMTYEQIKHQGIYLATLIADLPLAIEIVTRYPDYRLFTNNCQNFVKYLLEALCPDAPIPNTIESVLFGLQEISCGIIPGAYPPSSILSADCDSFVTASGTSWWTATETSCLTAANYSLITMENISQYGEDAITGEFPGDGQNIPRRQRIAGKGFAAFQRRLIGRKALIDASRVGDVERVKKLLGINVNTEIKDKYGWTALSFAAERGRLEAVRFLVQECGADVSRRTSTARRRWIWRGKRSGKAGGGEIEKGARPRRHGWKSTAGARITDPGQTSMTMVNVSSCFILHIYMLVFVRDYY